MFTQQNLNVLLKSQNDILTGHIINRPKWYVDKMWYDLFDKATYWRNVIWYDFNNFFHGLETINTKDNCETHFSYT